MLLNIIESIILGIVQGAAEFIPISSSAHLIIVPWLAGWNDPLLTSLQFDIALHLGTLVAVLVFFAADWVRLIRAWFASIIERRIGEDPDRRLAWFVVIGTIPGAVFGALAESKIEKLFHQPGVPIQPEALIIMAVIIAVWGLLLLLADRLARHIVGLTNLTLWQAILIGLSQALAIFPGVSRSGATITAGLALGLKRDAAAKFSFLLSAPVIAGAGLKSIYDIIKTGAGTASSASNPFIVYLVGFLSAAIVGYLCIRFLLGYLQKHTVDIFVWYRLALAVLIVVVLVIR